MHVVVRFLEKKVLQGFVLHGSPNNIDDKVQPHKGLCKSGKKENNLFAVYATNEPLKAMIHALVHKQGLKEYTWGDDPEIIIKGGFQVKYTIGNIKSNFKIYATQNIINTLDQGEVYVLPSETFRDKGTQLVSKNPVRIHQRIPVNPENYLKFASIYCIQRK